MEHGVRRDVSEEELATITETELRYPVTITWSDDEQTHIARVPDLPGCSADGRTYEAAAAEIRQAMRLWIWVVKERGEPLPQPSRAVAA